MLNLNTDIRYIKGIGEAKGKAFARLGVRCVGDLLSDFPRAYEDRSKVLPIARLMEGEAACVCAMITTEPELSRIRKGMELLRFRIADASGSMLVTYFNQAWMKNRLRRGDTYIFYGKVQVTGRTFAFTNPIFEPEAEMGRVTGRIMPVYRLTGGISQRDMTQAVRRVLGEPGMTFPNALPERVERENRLCTARYAYENIHFPADMRALSLSRRRLVFEELFTLVCALSLVRGEGEVQPGIAVQPRDIAEFTATLPFTPTGAQLRAIADAAGDMTSGRLMNRLIQGDVGSGKTLVAAALIWLAAGSGLQSAFMAPTELLAEQHFATLSGFLAPFGLKVVKLTGSMGAKAKRETLAALASGEASLAVGTHALISEGVEFRRLGLVVTDEQHRFGVAQRSALAGKGERAHVLVMSATPIPRTLALIIYGDLDVSLIDELPPGRQRVDTFAVTSSYRRRLNAFIAKLVGEGRQVFVVCPAIEADSEVPMDLVSAEEHTLELRAALPGLRIECIHGRMKAKPRDEIMSRFAAGEVDVLVSTTVIEVGVDVPNAALMIIENAERFGLSQLHQLRGRVGRGRHKSYCVLVSDAKGADARERLAALTHIHDGFKIAEEDLRLRGPGDFFGARQHGLPELHIADLGADMDVLKTAQAAAQALLAEDPALVREENRPVRQAAERLLSVTGSRLS
ncbi:MAG TPA: ATP-dependent DNA helicase RecG [Candidatus Scatomorpha pullicola]|nr:ATP-dependent DNA helicase RecG [Candidatus Scatomorpha pullicola]